MKQPIRFFSIGLLIASVILFVVHLLDDPSTTKSSTDGLNTDEMIEQLEVEGFHVLSSSEYIKLTVDNDNQDDDKEDEVKDKDNKKEKDEKKEKENSKDKDKQDDKKDQTNDNASEDNDNVEKDTSTNNDNDEETITYTLSIEPNMLGPKISQLLQDNKIIDDAEEFNRYLELEGYAPYIQLGDYEVSNDMDFSELAKIIANQ